MSHLGLVSLMLFLLFSLSCGEKNNKRVVVPAEHEIKKALEEVNRIYIDVENQQIDDYLHRRNWKFEKTKSGLRYIIYQEGFGKKIETGSQVILDYEISLIRGEVVYSSAVLGPKTVVVDRAEEPTGLHEALKLLKVGDRAKIIIPSYLAYGLMGDDDKIPTKATLFYDLYIKEVH